MARFLLATFELTPPEASFLAAAAAPLAVAHATAWAIEIIIDDANDEHAVLFSTADDALNPTTQMCGIGFANGAKACSVWRDRGFPLVDAIIDHTKDGSLSVRSPCFLDPAAMDYGAELVVIGGGSLVGDHTAAQQPQSNQPCSLATTYAQSLQTPDPVFPATQIVQRPLPWEPQRSAVTALEPGSVQFNLQLPRWPNLEPFTGKVTPAKVWSGVLALPQWPEETRIANVQRVNRESTLGAPAFRFEEVEVLGFRIQLGGDDFDSDKYLSMIAPLNFHLGEGNAGRGMSSPDFRYRPATATLNLEILRYGKMKVMWPSLPLVGADFQSQHEMMVRILVGRVDDDAAQARDPAVYVPTIFVDNTWSKIVGRGVQGFDKRMADFCVRGKDGTLTPLLPDGQISGSDAPAAPLASIEEIHLVGKTGAPPGSLLMGLDCPYATISNWEDFTDVDLDLAYGGLSSAGARWRQSDFPDAEFRRSFARPVVAKSLKGFRSIQASPIGEQRFRDALGEQAAWINGTFKIDDGARFAMPNGIVRLTLHKAPADAPAAWKTFCELAGASAGSISLSILTGDWYRLKCSMNFITDDGLS